MRAALFGFLWLSLVGCDGCSGSPAPGIPPRTASAPTPSATVSAPPPAAVSAVSRQSKVPPLPAGSSALSYEEAGALIRPGQEWRMEVVSLGSRPRELLRHTPSVGVGPRLSFNIEVKQTARAPGATTHDEVPNPVLGVVLTSQIGEGADKEDDLKQLVLTIAEITVHPRDEAEEQVALEMKPVVTAALGRRVVVQFNEKVAHVVVSAPPHNDAAPPEVAQVVETISDVVREVLVPLPEVAVGADAAWRVMTRVRRMAVERVRLATYRVASMDAAKVVFNVEVVERAIASDPKSEALPDDVLLAVMGGESQTTVALTRPRAKLLPEASKGQLRDQLDLKMKPPPHLKTDGAAFRRHVHTRQTFVVRPASSSAVLKP